MKPRLYRSQIVVRYANSMAVFPVCEFYDRAREARFWACLNRVMGMRVLSVGHRRWV